MAVNRMVMRFAAVLTYWRTFGILSYEKSGAGNESWAGVSL